MRAEFYYISVMKQIFATLALAVCTTALSFAGNPVIKFGIVSDTQYDPNVSNPGPGRHYAEGVARLSEAVATFNTISDLDFVADLGDMTDRNPFCYQDLKSVKDKLSVPVYNIQGNHDLAPLKSEDDISRARALKGIEKPTFSFVKGNVRFIVLNSLDYCPIAHPEGSERLKASEQWLEDLKAIKAAYAQEWNGGIGLEQLSWLDSELLKADRKGQWAVLLCHIPLLPFDAGDALWNAMEVTHLLESHPSVKAVLTGHRHGGGYVFRNGIHHITFKGMVQGESNRYAVVTIDTASGQIIIDGYGDETDRVLEIQ